MERRLTHRQMGNFRQRLAPMLSFFWRCRRRMQDLGFTDSDKIFQAIDEALRAVNTLHFELHCQSVEDSKRKRAQDTQPPSDRDF